MWGLIFGTENSYNELSQKNKEVVIQQDYGGGVAKSHSQSISRSNETDLL